MMKFSSVLAVIGLLGAGVFAYWVQQRGPGSKQAVVASASPPASAASGAGSNRARQAGAGPAAVEVGKVQAITLTDDAQAVGSLRSRQTVVLRPEVSGRIAGIGFVEGRPVRRGQLLVQLDDALQRAQLQQAQASAGIARTNLQRNRELVAQNFVSQSAVDQSAAALEVAQAQVTLAEATLARMKLVAPFDGVAGIRNFDVGDYVKDGADLVNIEDSRSMYVDFRLPERFAARLRSGQPVEAALDALPGRSFPGTIQAVDAQLDANGRSLLVRALLDNRQGTLKAGMFARVRTVFAVRTNATVVPEEALVPLGGKQYVFKVVQAPDGSRRSQRIEADIGVRLPGRVELLGGLAAGDLVVTAGQARLLGGDSVPVKVVDIAAAGAAASAPPRPPAGAAPGVRAASPA